jgi:hypothetical protein
VRHYIPKKWRDRPPEPQPDYRAIDKSSARPAAPRKTKHRRASKHDQAKLAVSKTLKPLKREPKWIDVGKGHHGRWGKADVMQLQAVTDAEAAGRQRARLLGTIVRYSRSKHGILARVLKRLLDALNWRRTRGIPVLILHRVPFDRSIQTLGDAMTAPERRRFAELAEALDHVVTSTDADGKIVIGAQRGDQIRVSDHIFNWPQ